MHLAAVLVVACVALHTCSALPQYKWSLVSPTPGRELPRGRQHFAMGYHPRTHQVIIFGGQGGGIRSDTWLYSVASRNWTRVVSATSPQARFSMVYGMDYRRDRFLISTGEGNGKVFFNDVWAFDFGSLQWSRVATVGTRPSKRYGSAGGVYQFDPTRLYVSHGFSDRRFEDTFYLDLEVTPHRWVQVDATSSVPHARCLHAGAVLSDDRLVLWGGCGSGGHGPCPANDAWMLHAASDASFGARRGPWWLKHGFSGTPKVFPTMVLSPHNSVVSSRYVVMYGGKGGLFYGNGDGGDIGVLDVDTGDWTWIHADGGAGGKPSTLLGPGLVLVTEGSNTTISTGDYVLMFGGSSSNKMWMLEIDEAQSSKGDEFSPPFLFDYRLTHGLLMTLSWGILLPFGGTFARFYRHIPDALWFRVHRPVQAFGVVVSIVGLLMMLLGMVAGHISAVPHAFIGVFVMFLGILQPVNAYFRPHVHAGEPKTRGRVYWEYLHKYSGRVAMFLGMINPFWGLAHIHASTSFVVLYSIWFGGFVVFYVVKTLRGEPENSPFAQWCNTHILGGRWKEQASQSVPKKTDNPSTENMVTMGNMGN